MVESLTMLHRLPSDVLFCVREYLLWEQFLSLRKLCRGLANGVVAATGPLVLEICMLKNSYFAVHVARREGMGIPRHLRPLGIDEVFSAVGEGGNGLGIWLNSSLRSVSVYSSVSKLGPSLTTVFHVKVIVSSILKRLETVCGSEMPVEFSFFNIFEEFIYTPPTGLTYSFPWRNTEWVDMFLDLMEKLGSSSLDMRVSLNHLSLPGRSWNTVLPERDIFSNLNIVLNCERRNPRDYLSHGFEYHHLKYLGIGNWGEKLSVSILGLETVFMNTPCLQRLKLSNLKLVTSKTQANGKDLWNISTLEVLEVEDTIVSVDGIIPKLTIPAHAVIFRATRYRGLESFTGWTLCFDFPNLSSIEYAGHNNRLFNGSIVRDLIDSPLFRQASELKSPFFQYGTKNILSAPSFRLNNSLKHLLLSIKTPTEAKEIFSSLFKFRRLQALTLFLEPDGSLYHRDQNRVCDSFQSFFHLPPRSHIPALETVSVLYDDETIFTVDDLRTASM